MADTKQTKTIGEHWAAASLARRGWAPALTRDGIERTDILAVKFGADRVMVEIQVKTATGSSPATSWPIGTKAQSAPLHDREWFILVQVPHDPAESLRSFVVPRAHLAAGAWISHMSWLNEPGIPAGQRTAGPDRARVRTWVFAEYEDRWDLLDHPTTEAPILLPSEFRDYALGKHDVGLPADHPWRGAVPAW